MQESNEVVALREQYESIIQREAYRYQQQIEELTKQLEDERKRNALLETELVHYLRLKKDPKAAEQLARSEQRKITSASIIDAREMKEKNGNRFYTAYVINITDSFGNSYTLYKRFKQFEVLHFMLSRRFDETTVPEFPPKHELISKAVKIPKRRAALQKYCNDLLSSQQLSDSNAVEDFFKQEA